MVEKQPIGRLLFAQFCDENEQFSRCCHFLQRVEEYETSDDDGQSRRQLANSIAALFAPDPQSDTENQPSVG